jgi:CTP:phosphocholine cytidylyltransferase-like protein
MALIPLDLDFSWIINADVCHGQRILKSRRLHSNYFDKRVPTISNEESALIYEDPNEVYQDMISIFCASKINQSFEDVHPQKLLTIAKNSSTSAKNIDTLEASTPSPADPPKKKSRFSHWIN